MPVQLKSKAKLLALTLLAKISSFRLIELFQKYSISSIAVLLTLGITRSTRNKLRELYLGKRRNQTIQLLKPIGLSLS
jgi:hypothetical protein